jgi:hypothetical protein
MSEHNGSEELDEELEIIEKFDRRQGSGDDRESPLERRNGWDRRRGPGRRRTDDRRAAEEGDMTDDQFEFIMAIKKYKQANHCPFPSYTEILEIAKALGYRKVAEPQSMNPPQKSG